MSRFECLGRFIPWAIIVLAALWLCLFAIPQFVNRISHHEDRWAREFGDIPSEKISDAN